jgi:hypothetical protein
MERRTEASVCDQVDVGRAAVWIGCSVGLDDQITFPHKLCRLDLFIMSNSQTSISASAGKKKSKAGVGQRRMRWLGRLTRNGAIYFGNGKRNTNSTSWYQFRNTEQNQTQRQPQGPSRQNLALRVTKLKFGDLSRSNYAVV